MKTNVTNTTNATNVTNSKLLAGVNAAAAAITAAITAKDMAAAAAAMHNLRAAIVTLKSDAAATQVDIAAATTIGREHAAKLQRYVNGTYLDNKEEAVNAAAQNAAIKQLAASVASKRAPYISISAKAMEGGEIVPPRALCGLKLTAEGKLAGVTYLNGHKCRNTNISSMLKCMLLPYIASLNAIEYAKANGVDAINPTLITSDAAAAAAKRAASKLLQCKFLFVTDKRGMPLTFSLFGSEQLCTLSSIVAKVLSGGSAPLINSLGLGAAAVWDPRQHAAAVDTLVSEIIARIKLDNIATADAVKMIEQLKSLLAAAPKAAAPKAAAAPKQKRAAAEKKKASALAPAKKKHTPNEQRTEIAAAK